MEFQHTGARFEALEGGEVVGWLNYTLKSDTASMTHTIVPERFGGRGVGKALVGFALEYARDQHWSVLPHCSFIADYIKKNPEFLPLVPEDRRAAFFLT
ncbi:MAG: N-acetyltransferase [Propionibacteriaceae bacterium]|nr:N-acetyltransferase [Propionibacteriaceae bacterium]